MSLGRLGHKGCTDRHRQSIGGKLSTVTLTRQAATVRLPRSQSDVQEASVHCSRQMPSHGLVLKGKVKSLGSYAHLRHLKQMGSCKGSGGPDNAGREGAGRVKGHRRRGQVVTVTLPASSASPGWHGWEAMGPALGQRKLSPAVLALLKRPRARLLDSALTQQRI